MVSEWGGLGVIDSFIEQCEQLEGFLVGHNIKFDLRWLTRHGLDVSKVVVWDTMIAEHVFYGNRPPNIGLGLGEVAKRYGLPGKEPFVDVCIKGGVCPSELPKSLVERRCEYDVGVTELIFQKQLERAEREGKLATILTRCLLTPVLADIETKGLKLNEERVKKEYHRALMEQHEIKNKLSSIADINWNSPKQVGELVYGELGFKELEDRQGNPIRTPSGNPKADVSTINNLKARNKQQRELQALLKHSSVVQAQLSKTLSKFNTCVDNGDLLYAQFNQAITQTHRLSSSGTEYGVQFQNMPRIFKPCVEARNEGWDVLEADGCFTDGHRMLMADGSYKEVQDVQAGDEVLAFDEERSGGTRKLRTAIVEHTRRRKTRCYAVLLEDGTRLTVSGNHQFLGYTAHSHVLQWLRVDKINPDNKVYVSRFHETSDVEDPHSWGALGAMLDCDGSVSHDKFQITQSTANPTIKRIEEVLDKLGFSKRKYHFRRSDLSKADVCSYNITGLQNLLKIQRNAGSEKVARKFHKSWEGKAMARNKRVKVEAIFPIGNHWVNSIQTTSRTYIVEGLCNHNCQLEFRVAAFLGQDQQAIYDIEHGVDVHQRTADTITKAGQPTTRQEAKARTFLPLFGGRSGTKAEKAYNEEFKARYAEIAATQEYWKTKAIRDKRLRMPSGLEFFFPKIRAPRSADGWIPEESNIFNYPIQSFATADIIPIALVYTWHGMKQAGLQSFIFNTVHDSVIIERHPEEKEKLDEIILDGFGNQCYTYLKTIYNVEFNVPLGCGIKAGKCWGIGEEVSHNLPTPF